VYGSLLYLAEGKRDLSAPWARYVGDIAGVTNPKIVIVDLYNQQVGIFRLSEEFSTIKQTSQVYCIYGNVSLYPRLWQAAELKILRSSRHFKNKL
jgi:hypothetical protein